ncbi:hypothetical protein BU17DRAFT_83487 [Hysterangium stoloniferum]|nr:hypothetical protein BU17DRAFT_83487 [Hysterangium stoloniferum]
MSRVIRRVCLSVGLEYDKGMTSVSFLPPPALNIVQPTPPRSDKRYYRLLYRGSLSLPDSELVLDGITFVAHVPPSSPESLMESPIALALESMRGRPRLRLIGVVKMSEVHHERTGDINMYIHPRSTLALNFFENTLCSDQIGQRGHTDTAIRIGLGDGHGLDESDLLVFGTLSPSQSTLKLTVARMISPPAPKRPRPDDPTPRRPPIMEFPRDHPVHKRRRVGLDDMISQQLGGKRGKIKQPIDLKSLMARDLVFKRPDALLGIADKPKGKTKATAQGSSFRTPALPEHSAEEGDVFMVPLSSKPTGIQDMELSNKTASPPISVTIKKTVVKALAGRGMPKEHPDFKELFGWATRGVGFALRKKIKIVKVGCEDIERLVDSHVLMYFDGFGGPSGKG